MKKLFKEIKSGNNDSSLNTKSTVFELCLCVNVRRRRGRRKLERTGSESDDGVASDGTEEYWSEEEEMIKVDDR